MDRSTVISAIARALMRGLIVQTEAFSVDSEKVVHWMDIGGEILIQGYDSFDLASFFVDMVGSTRLELAMVAANAALEGTAKKFNRPEILHHSDPHELFDEPSAPNPTPPVISDTSPPSTLRNCHHQP